MRSTVHLQGHPVHPMLIPFPFAYLVGSACLNVLAALSRQRRLYRTAAHLNVMGVSAGVFAAVPGVLDYLFSVPPDSSAHDRARRHGLSNATALTLFALSRLGRRSADEAPPAWAVGAELGGAALLGYAGYLGGTLVYRNQIGVDHRYADAGKWQIEQVARDTPTSGTVDVGSSDGLGVDQMKLVVVGGRRLVVARSADGWRGFDDRCPHKGGPLSDGALVCGTVQCPWHGSQFSTATGAVVHGPAQVGVRTYPVVAREGRLYLTLP